VDGHALAAEPVRQIGDEGVQGTGRRSASATGGPTGCGIRQEVAQHLRTPCLQARRIQVLGDQRRHDGHATAGSGDRDVEPALPALEIERTEPVQHPTVRGLAVADGQDDRVPLITLDPLEVLDEERLGR